MAARLRCRIMLVAFLWFSRGCISPQTYASKIRRRINGSRDAADVLTSASGRPGVTAGATCVPNSPPPTGEHLSARDTRTSVPFGGFGTCGAVAESPSAAAWREMGLGQLAL
jgi:hypothetical protein